MKELVPYSLLILMALGSRVTALKGQGLHSEFLETALRLHNEYRAKCGLGDYHLDPELNKISQRHAEKLALMGELEESNQNLAENMWAYHRKPRSWKLDLMDAVNSWYTGHKSPTEAEFRADPSGMYMESAKNFGIGIATTSKGYTVLVAEYRIDFDDLEKTWSPYKKQVDD